MRVSDTDPSLNDPFLSPKARSPGLRARGSISSFVTSPPGVGAGNDKVGKVGLIGSTANLANAAIGAGVLAFPVAFREAGLVLGPLLTIAFGLILGYTLHVISLAADAARRKTGAAGSYQEIVKALLGERAEKVIIGLQAVYLTGCNVCMLMIIRDQVLPILTHSFGQQSPIVRFLLPIAAWAVVFPMSLIRDMSVFAWPSSISQLGIFFAVGVVVMHSAQAQFGADVDFVRQVHSGDPVLLLSCNVSTQEQWLSVPLSAGDPLREEYRWQTV